MIDSKLARRLAVSLVAFCAVVACGVARSGAARAATCPPPPSVVHPFAAWNDTTDYVPATGGTFESTGTAWATTGSASLRSENEPWHVHGTAESRSLVLADGASATSPCTTAPHITSVVRFFARSLTGAGALHVELLVNGGKNGVLDGGLVSAGNDWQPTGQILLPWAKPLNGAVELQVRLTAVGGSFAVDDVYIDPYVRR